MFVISAWRACGGQEAATGLGVKAGDARQVLARDAIGSVRFAPRAEDRTKSAGRLPRLMTNRLRRMHSFLIGCGTRLRSK
jgi:hypothetical protein